LLKFHWGQRVFSEKGFTRTLLDGSRIKRSAILVVAVVSNNANLIASDDEHPRFPNGSELARRQLLLAPITRR